MKRVLVAGGAGLLSVVMVVWCVVEFWSVRRSSELRVSTVPTSATQAGRASVAPAGSNRRLYPAANSPPPTTMISPFTTLDDAPLQPTSSGQMPEGDRPPPEPQPLHFDGIEATEAEKEKATEAIKDFRENVEGLDERIHRGEMNKDETRSEFEAARKIRDDRLTEIFGEERARALRAASRIW